MHASVVEVLSQCAHVAVKAAPTRDVFWVVSLCTCPTCRISCPDFAKFDFAYQPLRPGKTERLLPGLSTTRSGFSIASRVVLFVDGHPHPTLIASAFKFVVWEPGSPRHLRVHFLAHTSTLYKFHTSLLIDHVVCAAFPGCPLRRFYSDRPVPLRLAVRGRPLQGCG